jgi:Ppx/GppA phosphatase family protein
VERLEGKTGVAVQSGDQRVSEPATKRRPKVYIAAAFRKFSDWSTLRSDKAYGAILDQAYVHALEEIEMRFLDFGFSTCLPHRDEGRWGEVYYEPDAIGALCFRHVETSDVVFALAEDGRGVHLELGYAAGLGGKPMILMYREGTTPSTLAWGLPGVQSRWPDIGPHPTTVLLEYGDSHDLHFQLDQLLSQWFPERKPVEGVRSESSTHALIDIGSHTLKFQVERFRAGRRPEALSQDRKSIGLMGHIGLNGQISEASIDAVVNQLGTWVERIEAYGCDAVTVVGTAALRRATNSDELVARIGRDLGWQLEILDADRELEYVYSAVMSDLHTDDSVAVLNVGGGSTQVGLGHDTLPDRRIRLDFGTRQLTQIWPWDEPLTDKAYMSLLAHVQSLVRAAIPTPTSASRLVHTGGELDFLLRCQVPMRTSLLSSTHVSEVGVAAFKHFSDRFRRLARSQACEMFDLDPAWAVGSVASNVIALVLAEHLNSDAIVPSNLNVSDGIALRSVGMAARHS